MTILKWFVSSELTDFTLHPDSDINTQGEISQVREYEWALNQQWTISHFTELLKTVCPPGLFKIKLTEESCSRRLRDFFQCTVYFQRLLLANHFRGIKWKESLLKAKKKPLIWASYVALVVKNPPANTGHVGDDYFILVLGISSGGGRDKQL